MLMVGWILYAVVASSQRTLKCPDKCFCREFISPENGKSVYSECKQGGMHGIPVDRFELDINRLRIVAPPDNPNFLTIGPILTHPKPFSSLRELSIVNSNVPSIGEHAFWGLHSLKTLNLSRNNITGIGPETFRGLLNLQILKLDYNSIEQMPSETFRHLTSLKQLSLAHNRIPELVNRLFRMLAKLTSLNLSFNPIQELNPEVFKDIQDLRFFKCRQCLLSQFNAQICHMAPLIEELDLGENLFKYLTEDDFMNFKHLQILELDGNQLSVVVANVFGQNRQMRSLNLAYNRIALLAPGSITNLTQLVELNISYNRIDKFHLQTYAPIVKTLNSIDVSGNNLPLREIALLLQILPQVETMGMANLSLTDIPPNFFMYNERLKSLDISSNLLTRFPYNLLRKIFMLQQLNISHNKIKSLNEIDLHRLEAIPNVDLSGNAWNCDLCSMESILTYMKTTVLNGTLRYLYCHTPMRLYGIQFADLTLNMLEPCSLTYEAQISVIAGLVLVLMAVLAVVTTVLCCMRRRGARYYTHEGKRCERDQDHPEELLFHSPQGSVATINAPYQHVPNCS